MKDSLRILICRLGGIGDVIHTLPLIKYLRKEYKSASIEYLTSENISKLLSDSCPYIDRVWVFNKQNKKQLASEILENGSVDYFFNLHNSLSFFLFNLLHIRAKKYFQYKKNNKLHAVVNFARTYNSKLSAFDLDSKTIIVGEKNEILNKHDLKEYKYICIVPGVGRVRTHRAWTPENWIDLGKYYLAYEKDHKVVFLGGEDEKRLIGYFSDIDERAVNLIGSLSLVESAQIISKSLFLISCDTGLLHLGAGMSKKVIGLYGPTLPERSGPFCGDCQIIKARNCTCQRDLKSCHSTFDVRHSSLVNSGFCMNNLTVSEVLEQISIFSGQLSALGTSV